MKISDKNKGIFALVALAFVFASMGVFARYLQFDFSLFQQTYLRIFAAFLLGFIFFFKDLDFKKIRRISRKDWFLIFFRAATLYGAILLISEAYFSSKYSNVSFIASFPLLPLFGFYFFKEKFTKEKAFYITLALIGIALIAIKDFSDIFSWGQGELLAVLSVILFDFSYIARKWQSETLNNKEITVLVFLAGSLLLFASSFFILNEPLPPLSTFTPVLILIILIAAIFNLANLFLTNYGFQRVDVIFAGNILTLETVFALLLGIFLYQEIPLLRELVGGIIIVTSVYQMNKLS
ncbi:MAG: DMT family transporter [Candidatus Paceibacterota bacterium]|jgi:drug/metabolite transporter (DMT)-like permease